MKKRTLGRTGLSVSEIGHGLWGMGDWKDSDDDASLAALQSTCDNGCNFYDTAWSYGSGASDALLGKLVKSRPDADIVTAGKIPPKNWKWPASPTDSFRDVFPLDHVLHYVEDSCEKAGLERFSLMQFHVWDDNWSTDSSFEHVIDALRKRNLCEHFGLSLNRWEPWNGLAAIRSGLVDTIQVIYNIFDQAPEDELLPLCQEKNVGVIARVRLDEGSLGGKLTLDTRFADGDWRAIYFGPENLAPTVERVEQLKAALPENTSLPNIALRFILQNPAISTLIVGMRKPAHIEANLAASDEGSLDEGLMNELRRHRWDRKPAPWAD